MRYELKNVGDASFYCVESAKLVRPGESIQVNRLDEGTRRLAEGPRPRLQIVNLEEERVAAAEAATPATKTETAPAQVAPLVTRTDAAAAPTGGKAKDVAKAARAEAKSAAEPVTPPVPTTDLIK